MKTIAKHQDIRNGSRVHHPLVPQLPGTVIAKGGNAWVTVRWDFIAQGFGTMSGQTEAVHVNNLVVFARPRPVIEAEAKRTDPSELIKLADLRHEWRLHRRS